MNFELHWQQNSVFHQFGLCTNVPRATELPYLRWCYQIGFQYGAVSSPVYHAPFMKDSPMNDTNGCKCYISLNNSHLCVNFQSLLVNETQQGSSSCVWYRRSRKCDSVLQRFYFFHYGSLDNEWYCGTSNCTWLWKSLLESEWRFWSLPLYYYYELLCSWYTAVILCPQEYSTQHNCKACVISHSARYFKFPICKLNLTFWLHHGVDTTPMLLPLAFP